MKVATLLIAALILFASRSTAQDTPPPPPAMDEATLKMIAAGSPNEHHKKLDQYLGTWDATSSFWMEGPDKPPATGKGTARFNWSLEGRFLRQEYQGYFMGMPYTGFGLNGYDNMKKAYTQFWIDNTSTGMFVAEGNFDAAGKAMTLNGTMDDPMTGEMNAKVRYVISQMVKDRFTFELYTVPPAGAPVKMGEIVYVRAQAHN